VWGAPPNRVNFNLAAGVLVFESLKKRRAGLFRNVPVPPALLDALDMVHAFANCRARVARAAACGCGHGRG
jgi:integrase/recombinase XerD